MPSTERQQTLVYDLRAARSAGELQSLVQRTARDIEAFVREHPELSAKARTALAEATADMRRRLDREEMYVAIVGEFKAGKSTFLNAMLGTRLLGAATGEFTGSVTYLREGIDADYWYLESSGRRVRFNDEVPDQRSGLVERLRAGEALARLRRADLDSAVRARDVAIKEGNRKSNEVVGACQTEELDRAQLDAEERKLVEAGAFLQRASLVEQEHASAVPLMLREEPRWWAFWWWTARVLLGWLWGTKRQAWRRAVGHREHGGAALNASRGLRHQADLRHLSSQRATADATQAADAAARAVRAAVDSVALAERRLADSRRAIPELSAALQRHRDDRDRQFRRHVRDLGDLHGRGATVSEVHIQFPAQRLKGGLVLMDTPGVNTPNKVFQERAWKAIEHDADACVLLTPMRQVMSQETQKIVARLTEYIPHVALVVTQVDAAHKNALLITEDEDEAREQCAEAITVARQQFAKVVGRRSEEVFLVDVSADRAIADDPSFDQSWARAFDESMARLLRVLAAERTTVLAVRCAQIATAVVRSSREAVEQLKAAYNERIRTLTNSRLPDPQKEVKRLVTAHRRTLRGAYESVQQASVVAFNQQVDEWCDSVEAVLSSQPDKTQLEKFVQEEMPRRFKRLKVLTEKVMETQRDQLHQELTREATAAANEIRERYRVVSRLVAGEANVRLDGLELTLGAGGDELAGGLASMLSGHDSENIFASAAGMGAGAAIGTLIFPGVGSVIGGLVGGLIGFAFGPSLDDLKKKVFAKTAEDVRAFRAAAVQHIEQDSAHLLQQSVAALESLLDRQLVVFNRWIEGLVAEEQRKIDRELRRLGDLEARAGDLASVVDRLPKLIEAVARESALMARGASGTASRSNRSN
ncbi:MAG: hypothetical protein JWM10_2438 [Myxococcaceae bacterium]|nr:hypothetical protein [Myxococcaceae bacterium]